MAEPTSGAKQTVYPEDLIWQFVRTRLVKQAGMSEKPPETWLLKQMPDQIELSEEFLPVWQQNVKTAVIRLLIDIFGHDPVLVMPDGETPVQVTTADRAFWEEARFSFSAGAVDRIWDSLLRETRKIKPVWETVTPWDAIFLACLDERLWDNWSYEWLRRKEADWLSVAVFLERAPIGIPDRLPWLAYFQNPREVPFPLRHRLILRTGRFFAEITRMAGLCLAALGSEEDADEALRVELRTGSREWQVLKSFAAPNRFGRKEILAALADWTGDGAVGLADRRYLDGAAEQSGLYQRIDEFMAATRDFAAIIGTQGAS